MKKRILAAILVAVMAMTMVAGCGSSEEEKSEETKSEEEATESEDTELTKIQPYFRQYSFWGKNYMVFKA